MCTSTGSLPDEFPILLVDRINSLVGNGNTRTSIASIADHPAPYRIWERLTQSWLGCLLEQPQSLLVPSFLFFLLLDCAFLTASSTAYSSQQ